MPSFGRKRAQRGAVSCPRSHSSSCVQGFRSTNSFTMAPKIRLFPKGNHSKPDLEIAVVPEGLVGLLSFGAYCELPMRVWGTQNSELSAHSCGGRSQPPRMTQSARPRPAPLPTSPPPQWPTQVRWGQASGSEGPAGAAKPGRFSRRGGPGPGNGPRAPPQPPLVQDRIFEDWSGQGWGSRASSPGAFGMQWKESSQALEGRGGTSRLWRRFPALSRAASSAGVLFRQGASPSFHRGQAPRKRGQQNTPQHRPNHAIWPDLALHLAPSSTEAT